MGLGGGEGGAYSGQLFSESAVSSNHTLNPTEVRERRILGQFFIGVASNLRLFEIL